MSAIQARSNNVLSMIAPNSGGPTFVDDINQNDVHQSQQKQNWIKSVVVPQPNINLKAVTNKQSPEKERKMRLQLAAKNDEIAKLQFHIRGYKSLINILSLK